MPRKPQPPALPWSAVTARRMARHGLAEPLPGAGPDDVARVICGAHAQVPAAADLSVGRRIAGATRADVQRALWEERTLVKTFGPRGTVHLLPAADLPVWTGAFSSLPPSVPAHPDGVRFSAEEADDVVAAIGEALADSELTVDELTDALRERLGDRAVERTMDAFGDKWPRWRQLTSTAAHRGVLCFGPTKGRNTTYTSPRRWLPGFRPAEGSSALRAVVSHYLHAYGPATPQDFARWLAVPPRFAVDLFASFGGALERVELEGGAAWVPAGDRSLPEEPHRGVRLLPYFDAYVVGAQPRALLFPGVAAARALTPTGQAGNHPVVLVDGVVGGVWHQRRAGSRLEITVEPLQELTPARRRQLDEEVALVGSVLGARASLTIGRVTVGAHA